ncbi:MAG: bifunctional folylpolyglutamate synthase/dihydrofolate synthase, partial [Oscillospiraceae bacterium]|nr:bifunctional folylpolyglutamate synthase/dihydrofolate synthase [Oscillospiraceae bacterium]
MDIKTTLAYIHSVKWQGAKPGLSRTRELLRALGDPQDSLRFVHVAGTNGKGSVSAMIASVLRVSGLRVGLYTSPYILRFNERMQVDGADITDDELIEMTEIIRPHADAMADSPTEFELITALAMLYFKRRECDVVVLEVGMGGELDSTNVIKTPDLAVITAIGLDHTAELGSTIAEVASAKAGIIKAGGAVACYGAEPDALAVIRAKCEAVGATLAVTDFSRLDVKSLTLDGAAFDFPPLRNLTIPLAG